MSDIDAFRPPRSDAAERAAAEFQALAEKFAQSEGGRRIAQAKAEMQTRLAGLLRVAWRL